MRSATKDKYDTLFNFLLLHFKAFEEEEEEINFI